MNEYQKLKRDQHGGSSLMMNPNLESDEVEDCHKLEARASEMVHPL